jgi:hypothetical protein
MDKYQKAAKLLNSKAPVDGQFGKERIAYLNPLEEEILKSIGGSGEIIIPSAEEQADPDVPSYGAWKWFKKKVFDDILGIDDNKFLGMGKHTFLGGIGHKVWDDWLGNDSTKSWGISDATWDDLLPTLVGFAVGGPLGAKLGMSASTAGGLASLGMSALDKVIENNSGDTSGRQRQREEFAELKNAFEADRQAALERGDRTFFFQGKEYYSDNNDDGSARYGSAGNTQGSTAAASTTPKGYDEEGIANLRAVAGALQGRGKAGIIDPSDTGRLSSLLASPGDENYVEGFSIGGQDMDPFPSWLRSAGDRINSTIDDTGYYAGEYLGDADQRMYDFMPILDRMKGMNLDAMSTLGSIFDKGEGGLESQYRGFQDDFNTLAEGQKLLNTMTAESNQGLVDNVLDAGDQYSASLADSKNLQTSLMDKSFDALSSLEDIKRMQNLEQSNRFADTRDARQNAAFDLSDAEYGAATGLSNAEYGAANRLFGSRGREAGGILGARTDDANNMFGSEVGSAQGIFDSTASDALGGLGARQDNARGILGAQDDEAFGIFGARQGAADRIRDAERAKSLAAGANAENMANANQRGMRSAMVGQGGGTQQSMGNAMIRAQLGQQRSDLLADALIRDADRRGQADIELAERLGGAGVGFADRMGDAGIGFADKMGGAGVDLATRLGTAGMNRSDRLGQAGIDYASRIGSALVDRADQLGASDIGLAGRLGQSNINLADRVGGAETQYRNQLEDILYSDADELGARVEADRFKTLSELDPGSGDVLASQANLQNQLRALGYGDQILNALGANIGIDQATLDDERRLLSDLTNMRLGNTSLIPALGMQNAQLPATLLEAALAPMGPLIRNTSPFTTTGQLPAPVTTFSPIAPPTQKNEWYDYAMMAPQVLSGIKGIADIWSDNG